MGNCQKDSDEREPSPNSKLRTGPVEEMEITCITWNKDYQGLFDYESKEITKVPLITKQSGILMKNGNHYEVVTQLTKQMVTENSDKFLFKFIKKQDCFHIQPLAIETNNFVYQKNLWMVVRSTPSHEYSLREGDVVKFGRQKIRVKQRIHKEKSEETEEKINKEINCQKNLYRSLSKTKTTAVITASNFKEALNLANQPTELAKTPAQVQKQPQQPEEAEPLCRICLDPGQNNNPLITPCKCSGSMRYIHLVCLQMWLGKRLNPVTQAYSVTINWKPLLCQLCMSHFLYKIYLDNKKYYTVEIPRPPKPYIVLEIMNKDKNKKKVYSMVSFAEKKKLNIGRKHDTDVRISQDISVSRHHSSIRYDDVLKDFFIEDASSKFGTLILIRKRLVVRDTTSGIAIQVGPNVFQFKVKRAIGQPGQVVPQFEDEEEELQDDYEDEAVEDEQAEEVEEERPQEEENNQNEGNEQEEVFRRQNGQPTTIQMGNRVNNAAEEEVREPNRPQ